MVTYLGLRILDPVHLVVAGTAFRLLAGRLGERADDIATARRRLALDWSGEAAFGALSRCDDLDRRLRDAAAAALRCDQVLCDLGDRIRRARALLDDAAGLARSLGVSIDAHGRATPTGAAPDPGMVLICARVTSCVEEALGLADEADRAAARSLGELARCLANDVAPARAPSDVPTPGADPWLVATWWTSLTEAERRSLSAHRPEVVGPLDGIPAADRDVANRLLLAAERDRLLALRTDLERAPNHASLAPIEAQLRAIDALEARLADETLPRAYLMRFSTADDGRAVVAIGNPDSASDVVTFVPGAGSHLPDVAEVVGRADSVAEAAARLGPDHQMSIIAWLGYDPPDGLDAALPGPARTAAPALDSFADGLRATHEGPASHNTVLAHSYGSLVAGLTARDHGLNTDELIVVGSPGVGVDDVADLSLPPGTVWSSTAADDPVQHYAPGMGQVALDLLANARNPFSASYGDAEPDVFLWHGSNPSTPAFGATVFASDPDGGHGGYWQGAALDAIARIALDKAP